MSIQIIRTHSISTEPILGAQVLPLQAVLWGGQRSPQAAADGWLSFGFWPPASFMTPITNEALHGLFLFMPSELPVCYSYLAGKQHQLAHPKCCVLNLQTFSSSQPSGRVLTR